MSATHGKNRLVRLPRDTMAPPAVRSMKVGSERCRISNHRCGTVIWDDLDNRVETVHVETTHNTSVMNPEIRTAHAKSHNTKRRRSITGYMTPPVAQAGCERLNERDKYSNPIPTPDPARAMPSAVARYLRKCVETAAKEG